MGIESVLRAAEAAGFATASDENEQDHRPAAVAKPKPRQREQPKDVLLPAMQTASSTPPTTVWTRTNLTYLLPAWASKG